MESGLDDKYFGIMAGPSYDDYLQRLSILDLLRDAGYVRNRKDGMRYPSFVRLDEKGQRIRGDKFIVTQNGRCCFHPPVQKSFNVISFIKEHPYLFPEYSAGMNLDQLVNRVCCRLLNTPYEEKDTVIKEAQRELKPFEMKEYRLHRIESGDMDSVRPFYPYFKHRAIDLKTQFAFKDSFVLAEKDVPGRKGMTVRNLSFPLTVPGGDGTVVGFEERGRLKRDGGAAYKGKAAGSNGSLGLWIASPAGTALKDARRVHVFESAYDAMAYYQLHRDSDKELRKAVFVSTGGNPTQGQMQGLIRTAPSAVFRLCFDNDAAGQQFAENFISVAKKEKPDSDAALNFKLTPGHIEVDHEKESAFFKLPKEVQKQYFAVEELSEDLRTGYLCDEDKEDIRARIKEGWKTFFAMVDGLIVQVARELPSEGYKDFNDELIAKDSVKKAVGCDLDGDGAVETEESNEERHRYHR